MSHPLSNYLRTYRRKADLSEDQIAYLLGSRSGARVSRYERFLRIPDLRTAIALEIIYHESIDKLFEGLYDEVARKTEGRMRRLARKLDHGEQNGVSSRNSQS